MGCAAGLLTALSRGEVVLGHDDKGLLRGPSRRPDMLKCTTPFESFSARSISSVVADMIPVHCARALSAFDALCGTSACLATYNVRAGRQGSGDGVRPSPARQR